MGPIGLKQGDPLDNVANQNDLEISQKTQTQKPDFYRHPIGDLRKGITN